MSLTTVSPKRPFGCSSSSEYVRRRCATNITNTFRCVFSKYVFQVCSVNRCVMFYLLLCGSESVCVSNRRSKCNFTYKSSAVVASVLLLLLAAAINIGCGVERGVMGCVFVGGLYSLEQNTPLLTNTSALSTALSTSGCWRG